MLLGTQSARNAAIADEPEEVDVTSPRSGPETGVHMIGWWRSIQRLRALLTMGATVDDLGAWVCCSPACASTR